MIYDNIEFCYNYLLNDKFKAAFAFLKSIKEDAEVARYDVCDGVYALVQAYDTKAEKDCKAEAHKNYIDIQYIISGVEKIGYARLCDSTEMIPYNAEKDVEFFNCEMEYSTLKSGDFGVYFPEDVHRPKIGDGGAVKKVVVKIHV